MAVQRFVYRQARGLSTDTTPNVPEYRYLETDTGRQKFHDGTAYQTLRAFDKPETFKNKTIDLNKNTIPSSVHPSAFATSFKRTGAIIPAANAGGSLQGALKPLNTLSRTGPGDAIYPQIVSSQEGLCMVFEADSTGQGGYDSGDNTLFNAAITTQANHGYFALRCKVDSVDAARLYVGYSWWSHGTIPISETPLSNTTPGAIMGFNVATTKYSLFHNQGIGNPMSISTIGNPGLNKDGDFHTFEMTLTGNSVIAKIDGGAHVSTINTNIPGSTVTVRFMALCQVQI